MHDVKPAQAAMAGSALPDARLEHLAAYFVELALCEYGALQFLPSCTAAAAVLLAQFSLGVRVWSPTLEHYSCYGPPDLQLPARMLHHLAVDAYGKEHPPASREKFSSPRCACILKFLSQIPKCPSKPWCNIAPPRGGRVRQGAPAGQPREIFQPQVRLGFPSPGCTQNPKTTCRAHPLPFKRPFCANRIAASKILLAQRASAAQYLGGGGHASDQLYISPQLKRAYPSCRYKQVSKLRPPEALPSWLFNSLTTN